MQKFKRPGSKKPIELTPTTLLKRIISYVEDKDNVDEYGNRIYYVLIANDEIYIIKRKQLICIIVNNNNRMMPHKDEKPLQDYFIITRICLTPSNYDDDIPEIVIDNEKYLENKLHAI